MKKNKVILDTNLWISFLITKNFSSLDKLIEKNHIEFVFSVELLEEFVDVVSRPKFKKHFLKRDIEKILDYFNEYGILIKVKTSVHLCRDQKDNFLLNLAIDAKADYLITGDNDLLILNTIEQTTISTYTSFIKQIS